MKFLIVGPNQGRTGDWGGFRFKDGACEVSEAQATDVENARRILCRNYSAYPDVELTKMEDGTLVRTCNVPGKYIASQAPAVLDDRVEVHDLVAGGLDNPVAVKLIEAGYCTVGELRAASDEDLVKIKGIGEKIVKGIRALIGG